MTIDQTCRVYPFPLVRRTSKVRAVAENLSRKHGKAAEAYWKQTVATLANKMDRQGIAHDAINENLRAFFYAVQNEMTRMAHDGRGQGGAA